MTVEAGTKPRPRYSAHSVHVHGEAIEAVSAGVSVHLVIG